MRNVSEHADAPNAQDIARNGLAAGYLENVRDLVVMRHRQNGEWQLTVQEKRQLAGFKWGEPSSANERRIYRSLPCPVVGAALRGRRAQERKKDAECLGCRLWVSGANASPGILRE